MNWVTAAVAILVMAITLPIFITAHYRYARLGSPHSARWSGALFLLGAVTCTVAGYLLFLSTGVAYSSDPAERRAAAQALAITFVLGGVSSAWLMPTGMRKSLDMAERNRERIEEEDRLEDERRGLR